MIAGPEMEDEAWKTITMKIWELISIVLSALVAGMFLGPWVALTRSISTFQPNVLLAIAGGFSMLCESSRPLRVLSSWWSERSFKSSRVRHEAAVSAIGQQIEFL